MWIGRVIWSSRSRWSNVRPARQAGWPQPVAAKESSSGSGIDEGGSLAGNVSATVLSIILSFFSIGSHSSMSRSSGSLGSWDEGSCIKFPFVLALMILSTVPRKQNPCATQFLLVGESDVQPGGQDNIIFLKRRRGR